MRDVRIAKLALEKKADSLKDLGHLFKRHLAFDVLWAVKGNTNRRQADLQMALVLPESQSGFHSAVA